MTTTRATTTAPAGLLDRFRQLQATQYSEVARDLGLLGARIGLAWVFIYHGAETLFGSFGGLGIHRSASYFANTAHLHPGEFFAVLCGITEFFGGIALGVGILSRLAAFGLVCDMVIATITVTFSEGFTSSAKGSGYELNVALAALALVVAVLGTGRISLDRLVKGYMEPGS